MHFVRGDRTHPIVGEVRKKRRKRLGLEHRVRVRKDEDLAATVRDRGLERPHLADARQVEHDIGAGLRRGRHSAVA